MVALLVAALGAWREIALPVQPSRLLVAPIGGYLAVHVLSAAALLWRRSRPLASGSVVAVLTILTPTYAPVAAAYAVPAFGTGRGRWVVLAALPVAWALGAGVWRMPDPGDRFTGPGVITIAGLLGLYVGARRRLVQALTDQGELLAEQARADERSRLAAEMHDVVTHRVNLMVLQAGALRVTASDEVVRKAAEELRAAGCQALTELRDLVGVLRSGRTTGVRQVVPGALADLVAESTAVGLPVTLTECGDPAPMSPAVGRTVYRVARESLTNVHKHAPGATATVSVHYGPSRVSVVVRNSIPPGPPDAELRAAGTGTGLLGLRGRVEMVGGTLTAEPLADGGFEVRAELPAFVRSDS